MGTIERDVFIPLRIRQQGGAVFSDSYKVVILPGVKLNEVYVSLAYINEDGRVGKFIWDEKPLEYGFYPAERKIEIPISSLEKRGIYYLEIGADLSDGGTSSTELWFWHPGR